MGRADLDYGRFISRLLVTIIPAAIASGIAVYVLYAIHVARAPNPADQLTLTSPLSDGLSTDERRELTRQMLKERRENPQVPAEVTPTPRPPSTGATDKAVPANAARGGEAKARPERTATTFSAPPSAAAAVQPVIAPLPAARPNAVGGRPDPPVPPTAMGAVAPGAAPPTALTPAPPAAAPDSTTTPPGVVNTAGTDPEPRGFAGNVFSSISVFAGTAANATGNTVNWVIDLPGKAISAGGRLLGGGSSSGGEPAPTPAPPAAAPAPPAATPAPSPGSAKRN
jgi:hypothetical protein